MLLGCVTLSDLSKLFMLILHNLEIYVYNFLEVRRVAVGRVVWLTSWASVLVRPRWLCQGYDLLCGNGA